MSSHHKFFAFGILILVIISIPLTVYLIKKQQDVQSHAEAATTLSFLPAAKSGVNVGDEFTMDITVDPGGKNIVSSIQLQLQYDPSVLQIESITPANPPFTQTLDGFQVSTQSANIAFATIAFGIGSNVTTAVQTATTAATVTFKALAATTTPTTVSFVTGASGQTKVLSLATTDNPGENVLSSANPASISIANGTDTNPTITPPGSTDISPTPSPIAMATPTPTNLAPVCTSLNIDRTLTGTAPYSVTFTANGYDSDGTIHKATFNFGDGPTQVITNGNGIDTNTVSIPLSHTYNNPGTYPATVTFSDNNDALSQPAVACSKTIVVASVQSAGGGTGSSGGDGGNTGGSTGTGGGTGAGSGSGTTATPPPPVSGATTTILGVIGGIAIVVVGALLFAL